MMPISSQALYFHLGMNADDDGFCEHFAIMRMADAKPDDLRVLQAKGFVRVFDDKVLVITDWRENNYLRADRYSPSKYLEIYKEEMSKLGIPNGNQMDTQVRLGEVSKEIYIAREDEKEPKKKADTSYLAVLKLFPAFTHSWVKNRTYIDASKTLLEDHSLEDITNAVEYAKKISKQDYAPQIITPVDLLAKWPKLEAHFKKYA